MATTPKYPAAMKSGKFPPKKGGGMVRPPVKKGAETKAPPFKKAQTPSKKK